MWTPTKCPLSRWLCLFVYPAFIIQIYINSSKFIISWNLQSKIFSSGRAQTWFSFFCSQRLTNLFNSTHLKTCSWIINGLRKTLNVSLPPRLVFILRSTLRDVACLTFLTYSPGFLLLAYSFNHPFIHSLIYSVIHLLSV